LIELSYGDHVTVDALSQRIFASRRQLQRAFAEAGTSVRERLHSVRMERSAELLHASSLPVAEIARSVGYRQPAQFAKAFRRYYHVTPSQWRDGIDSNTILNEVISLDCQCGCKTSAPSKGSDEEARPERAEEEDRELEPSAPYASAREAAA
jgi:AraC family transcriptional regulator, regulatory protein of adaptative response / methylphosphotriester-DNA alkyltransferase methyltransferase